MWSGKAEQSVLGAILVRPEALDSVAGLITPEDFYRTAHGNIFRAMIDLYDANTPVDLVTVNQRLKELGQLEGVGGPVFLAGLSDQVGFATNVLYYARIVKDKAILRKIADTAQTILSACRGPVENVREFLDKCEASFLEVSGGLLQLDVVPLSQAMGETVKTIEAQWENKDSRLPMGFPALDNKFGGLGRSDMIILAARPGMGKTSLALNISAHNAQAGRPVLFASLEMDQDAITRRLLSSGGLINNYRIQTGKMSPQEWAQLYPAMEAMVEWPLYLQCGQTTVMDIRARARHIKHQHGLALVVVDYIGLLRPLKREKTREQEISVMSRGLKALAMELKVPVLVLSQLNRELESADRKKERRPRLSDLRDSGSLEQDSDLVMFIYRDEVYNKDTADKGTAEISVAKHRNGPLGTVKLKWVSQYVLFENLEVSHE